MLDNGFEADPELLPTLLNDVFDLPVDWEFSQESKEISLDVLQEFSRLSNLIAQNAIDSRYHAAISFLWSSRKYVGISEFNSDDFIGSEVSHEQTEKIRDTLLMPGNHALNFLAPVATNGPTLSALVLNKHSDHIFELYLKKERLILRNWGLNQQSVEIIINRMRSYQFKILLNINQGGSVNANAVGNAIITLQSLTKVPIAAYRSGKSGSAARASSRKRLSSSKDKLVGIATLFGDAVPLVAGQSLSVVNFISNAAGATMMAILPRGEPRD